MIHVQLIGATQMRTGSRTLEGRDFGGAKPRQLLELLALQVGTPLSKERLADLLWDGEPPTSYLTTLEGYVSLLRGRLQPGKPARRSVIRTVQGGYVLDAEQVQVDSWAARALVVQARVARPADALPLLREALAAGTAELLASSATSTWAETARQSFSRLLVDAGTLAAQQALQLGQPDLCVTLADDVLRRDALAEEACRCAMRGLWALGRTAEALRRHSDLRAVLADELGVDPAPATQMLLAKLLRDEAPPSMPPQRRRTDYAAPSGQPEHQVDVLANKVLVALRAGDGASFDDDTRLVEMLEGVLAHLRNASERVLLRVA